MEKPKNDFFAEPIDPRVEAREQTKEVLCRLLLWLADAPCVEDRGLRASVALSCVRPDLIDGASWLFSTGWISRRSAGSAKP